MILYDLEQYIFSDTVFKINRFIMGKKFFMAHSTRNVNLIDLTEFNYCSQSPRNQFSSNVFISWAIKFDIHRIELTFIDARNLTLLAIGNLRY